MSRHELVDAGIESVFSREIAEGEILGETGAVELGAHSRVREDDFDL